MKKVLFRILIISLVLLVTLGSIGFILQAQKANIDDVPGNFDAVMRQYYVGQHMITAAVWCGAAALISSVFLLLMKLIEWIKQRISKMP